jgi:hypothetical protein
MATKASLKQFMSKSFYSSKQINSIHAVRKGACKTRLKQLKPAEN